jgi:hypothetical protein
MARGVKGSHRKDRLARGTWIFSEDLKLLDCSIVNDRPPVRQKQMFTPCGHLHGLALCQRNQLAAGHPDSHVTIKVKKLPLLIGHQGLYKSPLLPDIAHPEDGKTKRKPKEKQA